MNESELSKLCYLAFALISAKRDWRILLSLVEEAPTPPSEEMKIALRELALLLEGTKHPLRRSSLKKISEKLLAKDDPARAAGRALAWALDY